MNISEPIDQLKALMFALDGALAASAYIDSDAEHLTPGG